MYSVNDYYLVSGTFNGLEFIAEALIDSWLNALEQWFTKPYRLSLSSINVLLSNLNEDNILHCHEASVLLLKYISAPSISSSISKHIFTATVAKQLIATISRLHTLFPSSPPRSQDLIVLTLETICGILHCFSLSPSRQPLLFPAVPILIAWIPSLLRHFDPAGPTPIPAILLLRHLHLPRDSSPLFFFSLLCVLLETLLRSNQRMKLLSSLLLSLPAILRVDSNGEFHRSLLFPTFPRLSIRRFPWFP